MHHESTYHEKRNVPQSCQTPVQEKESPYNYILRAEEAVGLNPVI